jgi:cytochrome b6-f complex iron-sulfur subunit
MACDRRVVLKTIGVGCLASACGGGGGEVAEGTATVCGGNLCVSIAENPELAEVNGALLFRQAQGHRIYVVRTATGFSVVSALCTHANCQIEWNGSDRFVCPCHGSRFTVDGVVAAGPAIRALRVYLHTFVDDTLTITLTS